MCAVPICGASCRGVLARYPGSWHVMLDRIFDEMFDGVFDEMFNEMFDGIFLARYLESCQALGASASSELFKGLNRACAGTTGAEQRFIHSISPAAAAHPAEISGLLKTLVPQARLLPELPSIAAGDSREERTSGQVLSSTSAATPSVAILALGLGAKCLLKV